MLMLNACVYAYVTPVHTFFLFFLCLCLMLVLMLMSKCEPALRAKSEPYRGAMFVRYYLTCSITSEYSFSFDHIHFFLFPTGDE